jgi:hypothetical protein
MTNPGGPIYAPDGRRRVRFKGEIPPKWHKVTEVEYHRLTEEGKIIPPYDPDRPVLPWPDMTRMYIDAPDTGRGRHDFISITPKEEVDAHGAADDST